MVWVLLDGGLTAVLLGLDRMQGIQNGRVGRQGDAIRLQVGPAVLLWVETLDTYGCGAGHGASIP